MAKIKPLHEVFMPRARDIAQLLTDRGIWRWDNFDVHEKLMTELQSHDDGTNTLRYRRAKDGHALLETSQYCTQWRCQYSVWRRNFAQV